MIKMTKRECKECTIDISHMHPNAKFHSTACKDSYWNRVNPRGYGMAYERVSEDDPEEDPGDDMYWNGKDGDL